MDKSDHDDLPVEYVEQMRVIAREEAESVYTDLTAVDGKGNSYSFGKIQNRISQLAPDLTRREVLKHSILAFSYILTGATAGSAIINAMSGTAAADSVGQYGTQADPLSKILVHELESGDGASQINIPDTIAPDAINTDELDINSEVLIEAEKSANQSYSAANNWVTMSFDNEVSDVTDDFASDQFIPPETGTYHIIVSAFFNNISDGDKIRIRFRDISAGTNISRNSDIVGGGSSQSIGASAEKELMGGNNHEVQIRNQNGDCTIVGDTGASFVTISNSEEN